MSDMPVDIVLTVRIPGVVTSPAVTSYLASHPSATRAEAFREHVQRTLGLSVEVQVAS